MPRRVSLPGASELFRSTGVDQQEQRDELRLADPPEVDASDLGTPPADLNQNDLDRSDLSQTDLDRAEPLGEGLAVVRDEPAGPRRRGSAAPGTGRVRHEEKITVYVSTEELIALEETRLRLRAEHGMAVDRGRIVRQAISAAMADFATRGASSELVRKLSAS